MQAFEQLGVRIVGASFNKPEKNREWVAEQKYNFEVWSDTEKTLALALGAVSSRYLPVPSRITVILDAQGNVVLHYLDGIDVGTHPGDVLEDCRTLFGGAPPKD